MTRSSSNATPPRPKGLAKILESAMLRAGGQFVDKVPIKVDVHIRE